MNKDNEFLKEMINIIQPDHDLETGSDDCVYGSYLEWPNIAKLDESVLIELLACFDIDLPLGKVDLLETINNYISSELPDAISCAIYDKTIIIDDQEKEIDFQNYVIKFPKISDIREEIAEILREKGVPEGIIYENGSEMDDYPEELKYWSKMDSDDYWFYTQSCIEYEKYISEIEKIKEKINSLANDELVVKSLILSAFTFTESYVKSKIMEKIPDNDNSILDTHFFNIASKCIDDKLKVIQGREYLFKELYGGKKLDKIPNIDLRNVLAHDIASPEIIGKQIEFQGKKENNNSIDIDTIFLELLEFAKNLDMLTKTQ